MLPPAQWSDVQMTIAHQLHHMKPAALVPGRDVFLVGEEDGTLTVVTADRVTNVRYDAGRDDYSVKHKADADHEWGETMHRIYFDQLGEIAFGSEAKPWTLPIVEIVTWDEDGNEERTVI